MTLFVCDRCGATREEPRARQVWHLCWGSRRHEMRPVAAPPPPQRPEPQAPPQAPSAPAQGRLF